MKCQSLFSGKNINLSSAEFAHSKQSVKLFWRYRILPKQISSNHSDMFRENISNNLWTFSGFQRVFF